MLTVIACEEEEGKDLFLLDPIASRSSRYCGKLDDDDDDDDDTL